MRRRLKEGPAVLEAGVDEKRTEIYYWWLLLAIFFEYARPGAFVPALQAARLNSLIPLSLLVLVVFGSGFRPFRQIYEDRQAQWLTVFLGLILLSVPFAVVPKRALDILTAALGYYFLFLIIVRVVTSARRLLGVVAALVAAHLFLIGMTPDIVLNTEVRTYIAGGTFLGDGNDFSASLCILIPMTILLALTVKRRWLALTVWIVVVIFILAIVGSQSRGATLGLAAVGAFLWLFSKRKVASLMGITFAAMIMVLYASDSYFERMSTISTYQTEGSAQGRIKAWKAGTLMALDNPILGVGAGGFPIAFGTTHRPKDLVGPMPWLTAHSSYFLVLGELGFPGIVAFMALVIGGFRSTMVVRRRVVHAQAGSQLANGRVTAQMLYLMTAGMVGFAVAGAFLSAAYYPHIFVLTALLYCARTIALGQLEQTAATAMEPKPAAARRRIVASGRARLRTGRGSGT
jgi:probable O-glycosylation ligase (exosortase A-associated)